MAFGKKLTTFLAVGSPTGIRHVEIANWSGQASACPRNRLPELKEWDEVHRPGIYFLFEKFASESENKVHIGEADKYVLQKDVLIGSSSYAAAIVAGTSRSGPQGWVDEKGRTLKVNEEHMLSDKTD